jgi:hypothetical protein
MHDSLPNGPDRSYRTGDGARPKGVVLDGLPAGQDDFTPPSNIAWDLGTTSIAVTVTLDDPALDQLGAPKHVYKKTRVIGVTNLVS